MSKESNKKNHPRSENLPDFASVAQQEISFDDIQPLFDAQSSRLVDLLRRPEAHIHTLNTSRSRTFRISMFYAWGIFAIYCVAAAIYWGISLWHYQFDIYFRIYTLFIEGCFLFLAVDTVSTTLAILRHDPAGTPFDRTLCYSRHSSMRPLYLSRKRSRFATFVAHLRARHRTTIIPQSILNSSACTIGFNRREIKNSYNEKFSILNLKRTATIGVAVSFTLILVSCTPTVGDGHTLTQNHPARLEAVESVTNIVNKI